jgi:hypothetical protein
MCSRIKSIRHSPASARAGEIAKLRDELQASHAATPTLGVLTSARAIFPAAHICPLPPPSPLPLPLPPPTGEEKAGQSFRLLCFAFGSPLCAGGHRGPRQHARSACTRARQLRRHIHAALTAVAAGGRRGCRRRTRSMRHIRRRCRRKAPPPRLSGAHESRHGQAVLRVLTHRSGRAPYRRTSRLRPNCSLDFRPHALREYS